MKRGRKVLVEVSSRHVHLDEKDLVKLFGKGYKLKFLRRLSQPGEFAAREEVVLINGSEKLKVRVVGPVREDTQVELAFTDAYNLGLKMPKIRNSGELAGTSGILIKGLRGKIRTKTGVIIIQRHLHISKKDAKKLRLRDDQIVKVKIGGKRGLVFDKIIVRVEEKAKFAVHLDTDEGNAAGINRKCYGELIR